MKRFAWHLIFIAMMLVSVQPQRIESSSASVGCKVKKIGFIVKHDEPKADALAVVLARQALADGCWVVFADESKRISQEIHKVVAQSLKSHVRVVRKEEMPECVDIIVVLGGDGTLLSIARLMEKRSVPVMGINMGHLGFLTSVSQAEAIPALRAIIQGEDFTVSERMLCDVCVKRQDKVIFQGLAVNDAVIAKGAISRVIGVEVFINGQKAYDVQGDGVIISTPTGSTAYSLSAGGPLVIPYLPALIVTPICPHALTQRPLVIPDTYQVKLCLKQKPGHVYLTLDGQAAIDLDEGDTVVVSRFQKGSLQLVEARGKDYFALLREKLQFASSPC